MTRCPKCRAELIVPIPEDSSASDRVDVLDGNERIAAEPGDRPVQFELSELRPEDIRAIAGSDPDFLQIALDEPREPSPAVDAPIHVAPIDQPWSLPAEPSPSRSIKIPGLPRARDVVLPRSALFAWSIFAILGLGFAFLAGYLVGRVGLPAIVIDRGTNHSPD